MLTGGSTVVVWNSSIVSTSRGFNFIIVIRKGILNCSCMWIIGPSLVKDTKLDVVANLRFSRRLRDGREFWLTGSDILSLILDRSLDDRISMAFEGLLLVLKID